MHRVYEFDTPRILPASYPLPPPRSLRVSVPRCAMAAEESKKDDFTSLLDAELPKAVAQGKVSARRQQ
jgi:hypothetical protein